MSKKYFFIFTFALLAFLVVGSNLRSYFLAKENEREREEEKPVESELMAIQKETSSASAAEEKLNTTPPSLEKREKKTVWQKDVPFIVQAPFGEWNDSHFQNACEEASLLIAERWHQKKELTAEEAKEEILSMQAFEQKKFGTFIDTSLEDTQRIWQEYFDLSDSRLVLDANKNDLITELEEGNIVIVPADGQELKNPNFRAPGPPRHMLVIIGYDPEKKEFITNDPGTRKGKNYRYSEEVLWKAILDYQTGDHIPAQSKRKPLLVISRPE